MTLRIDWPAEFATGENDPAIARRLNCAPQTVNRHRVRLGVPAVGGKGRERNPVDGSTPDSAIIAHARARMLENALNGHTVLRGAL